MMKIEKFTLSSKPNNLVQIIRMGLICIIFVVIGLSDYLITKDAETTLQSLLNNQRSLSLLQMNVNYAFASLYESIATRNPNLKQGDIFVLDRYLNGILGSKKELITDISQSYPGAFSTYQKNIQNFMSTDLCQNYFSNIKKSKFMILSLLS